MSLVSGERIGGGLAADGLGELSKLLLGSHPAKALRIARDTGVLVHLLPELEPAIGFEQESRYHALTVDEHTFAVVQAAADAGMPLRVRLAALFHDAGKPQVAWRGTDGRLHYYAKRGYATKSHEQVSAELADAALSRLRYPTDLRKRVVRIVRAHMFDPGKGDPLRARKLLARFGDSLAFDLLDHKEADLRGKGDQPAAGRARPARALSRRARARAGKPAPPARSRGDRGRPRRARPSARARRSAARSRRSCRRSSRSEPEHARVPARAGTGAALVIRWEEPGYVVAFTTRLGGVSEAPYDSLNLTRGTGDRAERVEENRRIACESLGLPAERLAFNRQVHSPTVHRATPGLRGAPGDGLWTEDAGVPLLAMSADCLPIAVARTGDGPRGLAVLHAGWRGLSEGIVAGRSGGARTGRQGGRDRAGDRPVLLRGRDGGVGSLRRRPDARPACSISGRPPSARFAPRACVASIASTSAPATTRSSSSPTAATGTPAACKG